MKDWQQLIIDELEQLTARADALDVFLNSEEYDTLSNAAQMALLSQCFIMAQYKTVLDYRIMLLMLDETENSKTQKLGE